MDESQDSRAAGGLAVQVLGLVGETEGPQSPEWTPEYTMLKSA